MSKSDEQQTGKPKRLIIFALLNAYGQFLVSLLVTVVSAVSSIGSTSSFSIVAMGSPLYSLVKHFFVGLLVYITPAIALVLIPALRNRQWKLLAIIAMLLNAGIMLLFALTGGGIGFFLPMAGYLLSAWLVRRALLGQKNKTNSSQNLQETS